MFKANTLQKTLATMVAGTLFSPLAMADHVFVQIPNIPGESIDRQYKDWIDATAFGQDFNRRSCGGVTVAKRLDKASALLAVAAVNADEFPQVTVAVRRNGEQPFEYLRIVLSDVRVASNNIQTSDATEIVTESLKLLPRSVSITYRQQMADGRPGPATTTVVACSRQNN
jgi:type VI protein secretion system component Hcp